MFLAIKLSTHAKLNWLKFHKTIFWQISSISNMVGFILLAGAVEYADCTSA